jgi:serine phosphatase RsbU (regulator of sigma subunit)
MTAARFSQCGRRMTFAAACQPPAILISKGTLSLLDSQNGILGYLSEIAPSESMTEIELAPADRMVPYTDGLVEVFNRSQDMLDVEGLQQLVRQSAARALPEMKRAILEGAAAWSHGPLADEVSLVIVELR